MMTEASACCTGRKKKSTAGKKRKIDIFFFLGKVRSSMREPTGLEEDYEERPPLTVHHAKVNAVDDAILVRAHPGLIALVLGSLFDGLEIAYVAG
jgi:hypothetical protein